MAEGKDGKGGNHWSKLSDEELLGTELTTDDPGSLEGLVTALPDGYEDSYVEYSYDLRGSDRDELVCVHGHHRHLAGFVMRKDDLRWLVGWMCGASIYGERFGQHKADFNAAVERRKRLTKRREVEYLTRPLTEWLNRAYASNVFEQYQYIRDQLKDKLPWIWRNARRILDSISLTGKLHGPQTFFSENVNPKRAFEKVLADMFTLNSELDEEDELTKDRVDRIKRVMAGFISRVEVIFKQLLELEDAFQPNVLQVVCDAANKRDNPKKRQYTFGILSITCSREKKTDVVVQVPANFALPDQRGLNAIKRALEARGSD
jgi:hypothetical protein